MMTCLRRENLPVKLLGLTCLLLALICLSATAVAGHQRGLQFDRIALDNGLTLEYVEQGRSDGPVVIFVHGWLDSWYSWQQVLERFPYRYHAYAVTMRGHGLSDKPDTGYLMPDYAADLVDFMDKVGIDEAHCVGHSMGTTICQQLAISYPDRVLSLTLFGAVADAAGNPVLQSLVEFVNSLTDPVDQDMVREFVESLFIGERRDPLFVDRLVREELLVTARTWRLGLDGLLQFDSTSRLPEIMVPTQVIWGDKDQLFSVDDQETLISGIPDAKLIVWDNVGHAMQWEQPWRAALDIHKFLRRIDGDQRSWRSFRR